MSEETGHPSSAERPHLEGLWRGRLNSDSYRLEAEQSARFVRHPSSSRLRVFFDT